MYSYIEKIASLMTDEDRAEYSKIFEPRFVATPLENARRDLCVCADGEIRYYGAESFTHLDPMLFGDDVIYIASRDGGLSWKKHKAQKGDIEACVRIPWSNKYITAKYGKDDNGNRGYYCLTSDIGPGDTNPEVTLVTDKKYADPYQPVFVPEKKRIIFMTYFVDKNSDYYPTVIITDDDGKTFRINELPTLPRFEPKPPHKALRWNNNGAEPSITQLADGRLWMLIRTSHDYMYECFSSDGGDTWTTAAPSRFHMTLTTPYALTLRDGRTILFWNNTHCLPELDMDTYMPPISKGTKLGFGEDVFTNRDASHAAITEDSGHTFIGMRETILTPTRDKVYFRTDGGWANSSDKSVHQHQAIELPDGKIMLAVGQHFTARAILIFDVNWLYETERHEDFSTGLGAVSTHGYVKSISEDHRCENGSIGHCAWNRIPSVLPVADPAGDYFEALQFVYSDDPRLFNGISGLAWNFPAARQGSIETKMYRAGHGLKVSLSDVWLNPTDTEIDGYVAFTFDADDKVIPADKWVVLRLDFDVDAGEMSYYVDGELAGRTALTRPFVNGVSYLHLQTLARERDYAGSYIRGLDKK